MSDSFAYLSPIKTFFYTSRIQKFNMAEGYGTEKAFFSASCILHECLEHEMASKGSGLISNLYCNLVSASWLHQVTN